MQTKVKFKKIGIMKTIQNKIVLSLLLILGSLTRIFAQDEDPGFGFDDGFGDGGDPGAAPINDWLPFLLLVGIALAFYYIHKRKTITN